MVSTENKILRKRLLSSYVSSVLSISLVLLLVGIASLLLVNAGNVSAYFKEHMQISVIFDQSVNEERALAFSKSLDSKDYIKSTEFVSKEQGIKEMEDLLGADFLSVFDTSPIPLSLNVSLRADYVTPGQVDSIMTVISSSRLVEDVVWQKSLIEKLNSNLSTISLVLGVFIVLLLFISFVLINNTVRLNIYSKRFTIHTMRLVGATKDFIRRPFLAEAVFQGLISALLAILALLLLLLFVKTRFPQLFTVFQLKQLLSVVGIVIVSGILICISTTFVIVGRMVSLKKEELYG